MGMHMDGNRDGGDDLTEQQVFDAGYEMAPLDMSSTALMLDLMYGVSDRVTLMATAPLVFNSMGMRTMEGDTFDMEASGIGDVRLGALVGLWHGAQQGIHLQASVQLPTGAVDATDDMPDCPDCKVDYPTQLGSGTWDIVPGLTWVGESGRWSWGANWIETLRLGTNSEAYAFGNRHELSAWGVRGLSDSVSTSLRMAGAAWGNLDGADPDLDPSMSPSQDPRAQGGKRIALLLGLGIKPSTGGLSSHRFALEVGLPIWQDLDGPQLAASWSATLSWQLWF
jgi:hypothetical protein